MDQDIPTLIYEIQVKYDKLCSRRNIDTNSYIGVFFSIVDIINLLEGKQLYMDNHGMFCSELYELFKGKLSKKIDLEDNDKALLLNKFKTMSEETRNLFVM